jgi:hypothetical protein
VFFRTLKNFIEIYGNSVATGLDFKAVLEENSGMDFTDYFDQWYFGAGYPIYEASWEQEDGVLNLYSMQSPSSESNPLFKMSMEFLISYEGGDTVIRVFQEKNQELYQIPMIPEVKSVVIDPNNQVLNLVKDQLKGASASLGSLPFSIYPNPNEGMFFFKSLSGKDEHIDVDVEIYDLSGKLVYGESFKGCLPFMDYGINTQNLATGAYFVRFRTEAGETLLKMMVR